MRLTVRADALIYLPPLRFPFLSQEKFSLPVSLASLSQL